MRLGLIGKNISHSQSPRIYKELLGTNIIYDLIDVPDLASLPSIHELAKIYDGLNITAPYKKSYLNQVQIDDSVQDLFSINTISFGEHIIGTNTDYFGLKTILARYVGFEIILLGNGSMAQVTLKVMKELKLTMLEQFYRLKDGEIFQLDLSRFTQQKLLIINSCSRSFCFQGKLPPQAIFLDYNYDFISHQNLKSQLLYQDGLELLQLQAEAAVNFWNRTGPKLK
jgi:shikimate 5-dehydrogenase